METSRSFKPSRALIGLAMILGGLGVVYWELFVHVGRIRIIGLAAASLIGVLGGVVMLLRSFAKVCARCGSEIEATELAFGPELFPIVQSYAIQRGPVEALLCSRQLGAEDRQRAVLVADGCSKCASFARVASHLAVWNQGGYFEATQGSPWRPVGPDEQAVLAQLLGSRMRSA